MTPIALATKDNASGQLNAGINASVLSIALKSGEGASFPQAYTGSATSSGTATTLNSTGISAAIGGSAAEGKFIWNKTDGSIARIKSVATDSVTTTRLIGGTGNTWDDEDVWCIDPFVVTFEKVSTSQYGVQSTTQFEEALIIGRSTDTLTVASDGRGYNGTVANTFEADDYVFLHVTSPIIERLKDIIGEIAQLADTNKSDLAALIADLASTSNGEGASLIGVEDSGGNFSGEDVEAVLAELQGNIDDVSASVEGLEAMTAGETINGATLPVPVYQSTSDEEVYACDANDTAKLRFIGFAVSNSTDGNSINVLTHGVVDGFSGLTVGADYFVTNTVGTIGTTPGDTVVYVGKAISATSLSIGKRPLFQSGSLSTLNSSSAGNNDATVTVGFKPSRIILRFGLRGRNGTTNLVKRGVGTFIGTTLMALQAEEGNTNDTSSGVVEFNQGSDILYSTGGTISLGTTDNDAISITITINSVSDTGFVIRRAIAPGTSPDISAVAKIAWEAYE